MLKNKTLFATPFVLLLILAALLCILPVLAAYHVFDANLDAYLSLKR